MKKKNECQQQTTQMASYRVEIIATKKYSVVDLVVVSNDSNGNNNKVEEKKKWKEEKNINAKNVDFTPANNADYKTKQYWEERFEKESVKEWLGSFEELRESILQSKLVNLYECEKILVLGCGNSTLSQDLMQYLSAESNTQNRREKNKVYSITSIDFSSKVIAKMREKDPTTTYLEMDMLDLKFPKETFDLIFDKAAMDALLTDEKDPWNPDEETENQVLQMMESVGSVLKANGCYMQVSFQQPHFRMRYLKNAMLKSTTVKWHDDAMEKILIPPTVGLDYYIYTVQKKNSAS